MSANFLAVYATFKYVFQHKQYPNRFTYERANAFNLDHLSIKSQSPAKWNNKEAREKQLFLLYAALKDNKFIP